MLLGLGLRLAGLFWGEGYSYFCQGDGLEAYSVAVDYLQGEARAQYLGQPNFNEHSKLPGPLWTLFCVSGLRVWGSMEGVILAIIVLNTAAIWLIYRLAEKTLGFPSCFWAALFAATLPSAVYYSTAVYNPNVMVFLASLLCLALWNVVTVERSRQVFWVVVLLLAMPQFHMSGLLVWPAVIVVLVLNPRALNIPWLIAGVISGALLYAPYVAGEIAHGWQNTAGMRSGKGGFSWDSLKAVTVSLNLLVNWVPQWTTSAAEYCQLGNACFGWFGLLLAFNAVSAIVAGSWIAGAFLEIRGALRGLWRSPREVFRRSPGVTFLFLLLVVPLACALLRGGPFHARYGLLLLPPMLPLAGRATVRWLASPRWRGPFALLLGTTLCVNAWFMPALYWHQGRRIARGDFFVPSFRKLETVYRQLKIHAGGQKCVIDDRAYLESLSPAEKNQADAKHIRYYVAVREKECGRAHAQQGATVTYRLCRSHNIAPGDPRVAFAGNGVALIADKPVR